MTRCCWSTISASPRPRPGRSRSPCFRAARRSPPSATSRARAAAAATGSTPPRPCCSALLRAFYRRADVVFVHGEASRREFLDTWSARDVHVIPHGDERLLAPETPPPPADGESILFFGEWRRAKGLHVLIEAFDALAARRPEARLTIAGRADARRRSRRGQAWAEGHGGRVTLVDRYLEIPEVRDVFARARVVAAPYVAGSQSGVVHLAMTMARPVVASDVGELPHAVADGVTGRVVPSGDSAALCGRAGAGARRRGARRGVGQRRAPPRARGVRLGAGCRARRARAHASARALPTARFENSP